MHNYEGMPKTPTLLPSVAVCEQLGIDRSTLSRWVASKRITPAMKLPTTRGPFLFDPAEVNRVAAELAAQNAATA